MGSHAVEADTLVREAHERVYRFPPGFPGFRAALWWQEESAEGVGTVDVRLERTPAVEVTGAGEAPWVERELRSIVSHRSPHRYQERDGAFAKRLGETSGLGTTVAIEDTMDFSYVVAEGQIALVTRTIAEQRFTIIVQDRTVASDGTAVPTAFTVAFWNLDGRLVAAEAYTDSYADLDGVLVPQTRTVVRAEDGGTAVRRLRLSAHELVEAAS